MDRRWMIVVALAALTLGLAGCSVSGGGGEQPDIVARPTFTPAAGTFTSAQSVTIATATPGAPIRYTTDGSTPSATAGTLYAGPVTVDASTTLKAAASKTGWETSAVASAAYVIEYPADEPTFDPPPGLSLRTRAVTIVTATPGASIRYTTDGSTPGRTTGLEYTAPVLVVGSTTLKAVAYGAGRSESPVASGDYFRAGLDVVNHTVAVKSDGTVWSWGYNPDGRLGDGTTTNRPTPAPIAGLAGFATAAVGSSFSIALKADGTVWSWGDNYFGQLGDGTTVGRTSPAQIPGLADVVAIAAGAYHVAAVKADGTVWSWGRNMFYQLGTWTVGDSLSPVQAAGVTGAVDIAAGHSHTLALRSDGTVWAWGYNSYGQLGGVVPPAPGLIPGITGATAVAAGQEFSLILTEDGTVWAFGENTQGQLGDGTLASRYSPASVPGLAPAVSVEAGVFQSLAALADGSVRAWGYNNSGSLGDGTTTNSSTPVVTAGLDDVIGVVAGLFSSFAFRSDGTLWAWGENYTGQLGDGTTTRRLTPVLVIW